MRRASRLALRLLRLGQRGGLHGGAHGRERSVRHVLAVRLPGAPAPRVLGHARVRYEQHDRVADGSFVAEGEELLRLLLCLLLGKLRLQVLRLHLVRLHVHLLLRLYVHLLLLHVHLHLVRLHVLLLLRLHLLRSVLVARQHLSLDVRRLGRRLHASTKGRLLKLRVREDGVGRARSPAPEGLLRNLRRRQWKPPQGRPGRHHLSCVARAYTAPTIISCSSRQLRRLSPFRRRMRAPYFNHIGDNRAPLPRLLAQITRKKNVQRGGIAEVDDEGSAALWIGWGGPHGFNILSRNRQP